jgi:hypothetical protein
MGLQASGALTPSQPNPNAALAAQNAAQQKQMQSMEQQQSRAAALQNQGTEGAFLANPAFAAQVADLIGQPGANIGSVQQAIYGQQPQDWFTPQSTGQASVFTPQQGLASGNVG